MDTMLKHSNVRLTLISNKKHDKKLLTQPNKKHHNIQTEPNLIPTIHKQIRHNIMLIDITTIPYNIEISIQFI